MASCDRSALEPEAPGDAKERTEDSSLSPTIDRNETLKDATDEVNQILPLSALSGGSDTKSSEQHQKPSETSPIGSYLIQEDENDSQVDDKRQLLNKIQQLQDQLLGIEQGVGVQERLRIFEATWESKLKENGMEKERDEWIRVRDMRARSFIKNTTEMSLGRDWSRQNENNAFLDMMGRKEFDEQLLRRRQKWEQSHNIVAAQNEEAPLRMALFGPGTDTGNHIHASAYFDTDLARWNDTPVARNFDARERDLQANMNDLLRARYASFSSWRALGRQGPPIQVEDTNKCARPRLNFVNWTIFRYEPFEPAGLSSASAIDILEGEPDSSVTIDHYHELKRTWERSKDMKEVHSANISDIQTQPIDRVRLNGPQLIETLKLLSEEFPWVIPMWSSRLVIIAPFRILVYHEKAIRSRYESMKKRFSELNTEEGEAPTEHSSLTEAGLQTAGTEKSNNKVESNESSQDVDAEDQEHPGDRPQVSQEDAQHEPGSTDEPEQEQPESPTRPADSQEAMEHLGCLIELIDTRIIKKMESIRDGREHKISFRDLWYLFQPGDEVIQRDGRQIYRVVEVINPEHRVSARNFLIDYDEDDTTKFFKLNCVYVDFDGRRFGPVTKVFVIKSFAAERAVDSLEVYPLRFHRTKSPSSEAQQNEDAAGWQSVRQDLIDRGKRFFRAARMKLVNTFYSGLTAAGDEIESQVVIDFETALSSAENIGPEIAPQIESVLSDANDNASINSSNCFIGCEGFCCEGQNVLDDSWIDEQRKAEYVTSLVPQSFTTTKLPSVAVHPRRLDDTTGDNALTDAEYVLMTNRVFAFILRTRKWAELDLALVESTEDTDLQSDEEHAPKTAFDQLVLPEGHKNIVLSLISQHYRNRESGRRSIEHSDIVRGKGKGLILLLHGAPGVGKTSTAEGVAELFKKPLFTITCGDLGSTAQEVEKALDINFNLANRWGCILLLDEADVFLASRTDVDFERNGLVAVFLRVLEYYAGILFLTTNRVGVIDEAFRSRIHISLYYPALGPVETKRVFQLNLDLIQERFDKDKRKIKIDSTDIILAAMSYYEKNPHARWNGRQIRNACQTALALAEFNAQGGSHRKILSPDAEVHLEVSSFHIVSKAYLEFTTYLKKLFGVTEETRAKELGFRAREPGRRARNQDQAFQGWETPQEYQTGFSQPQYQTNVPPTEFFQTAQGGPLAQSSVPMSGQGTIGPAYAAQHPGPQMSEMQSGYYFVNPSSAAPAGSNVMIYRSQGQAPGPATVQMPHQGSPAVGAGASTNPAAQFQPPQHAVAAQQPQAWAGLANPAAPSAPSADPAQTVPQFQPQQVVYQDPAVLRTSQRQMIPTTQGNMTSHGMQQSVQPQQQRQQQHLQHQQHQPQPQHQQHQPQHQQHQPQQLHFGQEQANWNVPGTSTGAHGQAGSTS